MLQSKLIWSSVFISNQTQWLFPHEKNWTINCNETIVQLSWNMLNQQSQHLLCFSDTDRHSHFTILPPQRLTGRTPKLRRPLTNATVIGRQAQLQPQPADTSTGHQIPIWTSSCQVVPLILEVSIESWWGTVTVRVRGDESGRVQLMMHLGRLTWLVVVVRKALWFCHIMLICMCFLERERQRVHPQVFVSILYLFEKFEHIHALTVL